MPSGAGLNYYNKQILLCAAGTGSFDSGIQAWEAAFFSKTSFQLILVGGTPNANPPYTTGWAVQLFGTHDQRAQWTKMNPQIAPYDTVHGFTFPTSSWVPITAPSPDSGTNTWLNPLTDLGQTLYTPEPFVAIRAVATATSSTCDIAVICTRIP